VPVDEHAPVAAGVPELRGRVGVGQVVRLQQLVYTKGPQVVLVALGTGHLDTFLVFGWVFIK
jgi:hypothetical protein